MTPRAYITIGALVLSYAFVVWATLAVNNGRWQAKEAREVAAQIEAQKRMVKNADKAATEYQSGLAIDAANLAVVTGTLDRLHADLANLGAGQPSSSPAIARIAGILDQCASEVVRLAGDADRLAGKVTGWQEWFEATSAK
jgi:hypothetical protein